MLRTVINILLVTLLLISTTGVAVSKHYCDSDLISVELSGDHPCCDVEACCETDTEFHQVKNDFLVSALSSIAESPFTAILNSAPPKNDIKYPANRFFSTFTLTCPLPRNLSVRLALGQVYRL